MQESKQDRSLGELFSDLSRQTTTLVRQEIALAKTELSDKVADVGKNVGMLVAGGMVAYAGLLYLGAALILGLIALGLPSWLSALLVGIIVIVGGYFLIQRGRAALKQADLVPRATIATLKEDKEWIKDQTQ